MLVGEVGISLLVVVIHASTSMAGRQLECHNALGGRPDPAVPLSPLRREEDRGRGHFDHFGGHLREMGELREARPFGGDDGDPRT